MTHRKRSEIKLIARAANKYARIQIREGSTQLQNNAYDLNKRLALKIAVEDIREASEEDRGFFLSIDFTLRCFEQLIANCKKLSIGNCYELALMALHYMIKEHPDMNAEVYRIEGGDHVFLVIGRERDSDPNRPETWGDGAYICDPWSDNVYPAIEYLTKTKNFHQLLSSDGSYTNHIEDFKPSKHKLFPIENLNTSYILGTITQSNTILLDVFSTLNESYLDLYDNLAVNLDKIAIRLKDKYGEDDPKYKIIKEKILMIRKITDELRENFNVHVQRIEGANSSNAYQSHKDLNDNLKQLTNTKLMKLRKSRTLSAKESVDLNVYRQEESLLTMIMKFLHINPQSSREYNSAVTNSTVQINKLSTLVRHSFRK